VKNGFLMIIYICAKDSLKLEWIFLNRCEICRIVVFNEWQKAKNGEIK